MVYGLLAIEDVNRLCEGCVIDKHKCNDPKFSHIQSHHYRFMLISNARYNSKDVHLN